MRCPWGPAPWPVLRAGAPPRGWRRCRCGLVPPPCSWWRCCRVGVGVEAQGVREAAGLWLPSALRGGEQLRRGAAKLERRPAWCRAPWRLVAGRTGRGAELKQCSAWGRGRGVDSGDQVMAVVPVWHAGRVQRGWML
jgi:hypothetical protein